MSFQDNLIRLRKVAGYSKAKDFAKLMGISYTTYISYENQNREPKYDRLCKIADAFGVTTDELLGHRAADNLYKRKYEELRKKMDQVEAILKKD